MKKTLTPFDHETVLMLQSLTDYDVVVIEQERKFYLDFSYEYHNEPNYINAVINALRGRIGERLIELHDDAENKMIRAEILYDVNQYPELVGSYEQGTPNDDAAEIYCSKNVEVRAIQVTRDNIGKLQNFVGGGTFAIEKKPNGLLWFSFLNNGVFLDAREFSFIVKHGESKYFEVWPREEFERRFEPKYRLEL